MVGIHPHLRALRRRRHFTDATVSFASVVIPALEILLASTLSTRSFRNHQQQHNSSRCNRYFTTVPPISSSAVTVIPTDVDDTKVALTITNDDDNKAENDDDVSITNGDEMNTNHQSHQSEIFQKLLYDDAAYFEAYQFLTSSKPTAITTTTSSTEENQQHHQQPEDWKHNAYGQLFDAVIVQHGKLLDTYNQGFPTMMKSSMYSSSSTATTSTTTSKSMPHAITPEQIHTLQQMIQMAEIANDCIERMEPYLGARNTLMMDRIVVFNNVDDDDNHVRNHENDISANAEMDVSLHGDIELDSRNETNRPKDGAVFNAGQSTTATLPRSHLTSTTKQRKKRKEIDLVLTTRCNDVLTAWAQTVYAGHRGHVTRSYLRAIPQRAQFLLSRMELTIEDHDNDQAWLVPPSLLSYNSVLQTWAYSGEHLRAASAQQIFDKLLSNKLGTAYGNIRPDGESYRHIIWAWALSRERRAAFIATGHLIKMLRRLELGFDDDALYEGVAIEPSIDDYNIVARAWIRSEEKNSPGKAQSMLKLMERVYKKGVTMLQPDLLCYKCVFLAAAKRHDLLDLGPLIDETLAMMSDRFIVPDADCYTAAIKTWKNAALHQPDVTAANQQTSVRRTIELLAEMDVAHNQSMMVSISVSTENINDVLEALTVSTHHSRTVIVDELLDKLSRSSTEGASTAMKATTDSYIFALRVWRTMESMEKIAKGKAILWRVKDNYAELVRQHKNKSEDRRKDQIVDIFNEFVQLCGSYQPRSNKDGLQVLGEALDAIRVMRSMDVAGSGLYHKLIPNALTFTSLLIAVTNLLSPGSPERRIAVENIFTMCCTDGMVDDMVLRCFRDAATSDQFATMIESKSEILEGMKVVPESWTVNALGGKVKSADGRKTVPLGIDGLLKSTMAMKEFQMRRLLDHRNRELLRGGRWRQKQFKFPAEDTNGSINPHGYYARKPWKLYDSTLMATNEN